MKRFGVTLDMSRNAVMTVESVKKYVDYISLFGYNALMIYTEDTYHVNNEKFFGYLRGKYSKNDLKELDTYCKSKNIELIPCIQTLAHLNCIFKWKDYAEIKDIDDILLAENDRTYALIDNMFATIKECFSTKVVHIGMDEAMHLGVGEYLHQNGYKNRFEILSKHLDKVVKIAGKYGFHCLMWSDMYFRIATGGDYYDGNNQFKATKELLSAVNKNVELAYWDYYHTDYKTYDDMIKKHKQLTENPLWFAGGAWSWTGFTPHNKYTLQTMIPAMQACKDNGIENVLITLWGDNGGECSRYSVLPSLFYLKCIYDGITDEKFIKEKFKLLTGEDFDTMMLLDLPDDLSSKPKYLSNPSKYVLYSDLFLGFLDSGYPKEGKTFLKAHAKKLATVKSNKYQYLFDSAKALCEALYLKYDLSLQIRKAYKANDKKALQKSCDTIKKLQKKIKCFYKLFKTQWLKENKPHGFDIQDVRLGGLLMRLESCCERLEAFIKNGERILELEEEFYDIYTDETQIGWFNLWAENITVNSMMS